jgi:hypothetical protein
MVNLSRAKDAAISLQRRPTISFGTRAAHQHRSLTLAQAVSFKEGLDDLLVVDNGVFARPVRTPQATLKTSGIEHAGERIPDVGERIRLPGQRAHAVSHGAVSKMETVSNSGKNADAPNVEFARCFLRLANLPNFALDRLSRYEATLWRQVGRILHALETLDRRKPQERRRHAGAEAHVDCERSPPSRSLCFAAT